MLIVSGSTGHALSFLPFMDRLMTFHLLHVMKRLPYMRDIGLSVNERGNVLLEYHKLVEKLVDMSTMIDWVHIFIIYLQLTCRNQSYSVRSIDSENHLKPWIAGHVAA